MAIQFTKSFKKQYKKAPNKVQKEFDKRMQLFLHTPLHPLLNNHPLRGKLVGLRSINITGDWRALYSQLKRKTIIFEAIGTHSQLYK